MPISARFTVLAISTTLSLSCSDSGSSDHNPVPNPVQSTVVFTRADNTTIAFAKGAKVSVWCAAWEQGAVPTPSIQILYGQQAAEPHWWLRAVVADVTIGQPLAFPNDFIWDQPKDVDIFVGDPAGGGNELSTQTSGSSGSITFRQLDCGSGGEVDFTIDAVIGSEFGNGPSVGVVGDFRAPLGQPPSF